MPSETLKSCSICGRSFPLGEFSYGGRDRRSYCRACNQAERTAYATGGVEAALAYRETQRARWKRK